MYNCKMHIMNLSRKTLGQIDDRGFNCLSAISSIYLSVHLFDLIFTYLLIYLFNIHVVSIIFLTGYYCNQLFMVQSCSKYSMLLN